MTRSATAWPPATPAPLRSSSPRTFVLTHLTGSEQAPAPAAMRQGRHIGLPVLHQKVSVGVPPSCVVCPSDELAAHA